MSRRLGNLSEAFHIMDMHLPVPLGLLSIMLIERHKAVQGFPPMRPFHRSGQDAV
jgi:hypothetical protein